MNLLPIIGLLEIEAGLFASPPKRRVRRPKVKDVIKPPVSKLVKVMEKYKVKQKEICYVIV